MVAPPRGERGLKSPKAAAPRAGARVAPPRGERGLKCVEQQAAGKTGQSRSPSWGAWIEIFLLRRCGRVLAVVAPPRGERGLKYNQGAV